MSERFTIVAAQIAGINAQVRELKADNAAKTRLILEAQDRIAELEARLASQPDPDERLAALSVSLAEIEAALNPTPVEIPAAPNPALSA